MALIGRLERSFGKRLAAWLPRPAARAFVVALMARDPQTVIGGVAGYLKFRRGHADLDLFTSTTLDEAVISMSVRQAANIYGLVRRLRPANGAIRAAPAMSLPRALRAATTVAWCMGATAKQLDCAYL